VVGKDGVPFSRRGITREPSCMRAAERSSRCGPGAVVSSSRGEAQSTTLGRVVVVMVATKVLAMKECRYDYSGPRPLLVASSFRLHGVGWNSNKSTKSELNACF